MGKPEGKRPLGRPRRRWDDNIIMDLREVGCGVMDWIYLAKDRNRWRAVVNAVMNFRVPYNGENFLTGRKVVSFSIETLLHGVSIMDIFREMLLMEVLVKRQTVNLNYIFIFVNFLRST